ncbi:MAG: lysozyme inhibitor LprI family protein, partial [Desulfoprunum sp.]|nr:lysozyme inhibitor LprI family protein [Desulfoprunum sp.]
MKRVIWIFLGWLALFSTGHAASFDCGKASSKIEKLICDSPSLSALDEDLDKAYKLVQNNSTHEEVQLLIKDQRQWLKGTRNACGDEACLAQAYSSRIEAIKPATGNVVHPLTKIVTLESLAPVGHGYPEDIRQIDGDLVYSHYDNSGNWKNIVNFDFTSGRWFNWVEGKKDPKLIAQDSRYIVFHTPHSASFPIEVISRKTGASLSKIKLKSWVQAAFIEGDRLVLFQTSPAPPYGYQQAIAILQLPSLKLVQETSIPGGTPISLYGNRIYTAYSANAAMDLMVYDHQLKELGRLKLPPPLEKLNSHCQPQIVQNEDDRAVLIANCGEMHVLDLKSFSVERSIPRYSLFYSVALYKGLIFTTTEKQNGIVVFDMNSATEVARFPIPASYLFIKGDVLLAAEAPVNRLKDSSWPMQAYRINIDMILSGEWKNQSIINACSQAGQAIQNGGDIYQGVRLCGNRGINGVINSGSIPADVLPHAVNYATWLSQTLHRYDESLIIFDKLRKLGANVNSEAV